MRLVATVAAAKTTSRCRWSRVRAVPGILPGMLPLGTPRPSGGEIWISLGHHSGDVRSLAEEPVLEGGLVDRDERCDGPAVSRHQRRASRRPNALNHRGRVACELTECHGRHPSSVRQSVRQLSGRRPGPLQLRAPLILQASAWWPAPGRDVGSGAGASPSRAVCLRVGYRSPATVICEKVASTLIRLRDDPGVATTFTSGLLITELILRGDLARGLVLAPRMNRLRWCAWISPRGVERFSPAKRLACYSCVMSAADIYRPEQWTSFFVLVGTGAVTLTGLVFVAISLNVKVIAVDATHRNRAINTLSGLALVFMRCALVLMGAQDHQAVGAELLVGSGVSAAIFMNGYARAIRLSRGLRLSRIVGGSLVHLAEMVGAALLLCGYLPGLYIAAVAIVTNTCYMITAAWLLVMGVFDRKTE